MNQDTQKSLSENSKLDESNLKEVATELLKSNLELKEIIEDMNFIKILKEALLSKSE
jgi:hypothetical protein